MISKRVEKIKPSGIRKFFDLVLGMPEVISLGVGEPDFVAPWRIREKAITALEEGYTSYTSNKGLSVLRQKISGRLEEKYSLKYCPEQEILITAGVSQALDLALRAVLNPGDKAVVVSPHYVAYPALVELSHGKVIYLNTLPEEGFKINLELLEKIVKKENPRVLILNYPSNPTGVTYTPEEVKSLWKVLSKRDILIISDETYDEIIYQGKHLPFSSLKGAKDKVIYLNGFSKGWAMTGFRVAYACGPALIIEAMTKITSFALLCAPIISQMAAVEALRTKKEVRHMVNCYRIRRDFVSQELLSQGFSLVKPEGAFYCFPSIKKFKINSLDFAKKLLIEKKVAVVPGEAFGKGYDDFIRISYANSLDNLKESFRRMSDFIRKL